MNKQTSTIAKFMIPLTLAVQTFTISAVTIPSTLTLFLLGEQPALAQRTSPFILRQAFGCDTFCRALVVSQRNGRRFVIKYGERINAEIGSEVLIEFDGNDNWVRIMNPSNGASSQIYSVQSN